MCMPQQNGSTSLPTNRSGGEVEGATSAHTGSISSVMEPASYDSDCGSDSDSDLVIIDSDAEVLSRDSSSRSRSSRSVGL